MLFISSWKLFVSGSQAIVIPILPNILRSQGNQKIKFGQLIDITREIFFFENHVENEAGRLVPDLFLFLKKALYEVKASGLQQFSCNIFR